MVWLTDIATKKQLGTQRQPRLRAKDIICIHTMVGYLFTTEDMFDNGGYVGTESHFGIGGKWGIDARKNLDGETWQFQDTDYTADANYEGSYHVISVETADNAPDLPEQIVEWTPKQVDAIVELFSALCIKYNIPPVLIPDTKPGRRGLAYHYQGVGTNVVPGGEKWSKAAHYCPGPVRIRQFKNEVIPRIKAKVEGRDWFDMAKEEDLRRIVADEVQKTRAIVADEVQKAKGYVISTQTQADRFNILAGPDDKVKIGDTVSPRSAEIWGNVAEHWIPGLVVQLLDEMKELRAEVAALKSGAI